MPPPVIVTDQTTQGRTLAINSDGSINTRASAGSLPANATAVANSSGNVANSPAVATLAGVSNKTTYIQGLIITPGGATAAAVVTATLAGITGGPLSFTASAPSPAGNAGPVIIINFGVGGLPASTANTSIVLTLPALGTGNTNASVSAWGYQL